MTFTLEQTLFLLEELSQFELGRFLLENRGLNGYWISYAILNPNQSSITSPLEKWALEKAPIVKATRDRFYIFQREIQKRVKSSMTLAAIPCGLMDNFLTANYEGLNNIRIVGIDLDKEALRLARENSNKYRPNQTLYFLQRDAWNLNITQEYDLIISNGLSIYVHDDEKIIELYNNFYKALLQNGVLITSFLTPPPALDPTSPWKNFNLEDLRKQKAIFSDIMQAKWQAFRSPNQTQEYLKSVGFRIEDIIYDSQNMFPTIIARK